VKVAITGADGFLGWHARCALLAHGDDSIAIGRAAAADAVQLGQAIGDADAVLHLAGVNRAEPDALRRDNIEAARQLTAALDRVGRRPHVVYANSIQSGNGTPFGDGKAGAAEVLADWGRAAGASVSDVRLPNLFGEHGRPHYNSVVATFCRQLADGESPTVIDDREIPLLHAQEAVEGMLRLARSGHSGTDCPAGRPTRVTELLSRLTGFAELYREGDIPDICDPLHLALFNTYRAACFPDHYPIHPPRHADARGQLFECVKGHGGQTQVFCSTSKPGVTRGEHFHRRKVERFLVLAGEAEIALRRLFDDKIVRFSVSGARPAIIDMPTLWAHSITNTGSGELMTLFWASEVLDPKDPDTYAHSVRPPGSGAER
jgi:UDP-2-acetamido-2,6-beta-L-arabino-hexul-4-ose reductase